MEHAEDLLREESSRTRRTAHQPASRPATSLGPMTTEDIACLRARHAFLADFSDTFIRGTTIGDLMKIKTTEMKMKEMEKSKDAVDKLSSNKLALASTYTRVAEGQDNRMSMLHPARFLPGAGCSATRLWLSAREHLGLDGYPAIGCYDMGAVGLAGHVSAKGWLELHSAATSKLSIKLFNINCGGSRPGAKKSDKEGAEEDMMELTEFKLALRAMRTAFSFVMPWNYSILALEGFYFQTNFCGEELAGVDKKVWYLTRFTDYVIEQNGDRWRDAEPFLTAGELKVTWTAFFGAKLKSGADKQAKKSTSQQKPKTTADARVALGICFAWNNGQCVKAAGTCKTKTGRELKHICDHNADPAKPADICGKDHIRKNFH